MTASGRRQPAVRRRCGGGVEAKVRRRCSGGGVEARVCRRVAALAPSVRLPVGGGGCGVCGRCVQELSHTQRSRQTSDRHLATQQVSRSTHTHTHTHTHPFSGPLSGTTQVSRYQRGKPVWILLKQETVSGSGISWAICKSAPRSRQITMPATHHSVAAARVWNSLPDFVTASTSLPMFKRHLKTVLFAKSY